MCVCVCVCPVCCLLRCPFHLFQKYIDSIVFLVAFYFKRFFPLLLPFKHGSRNILYTLLYGYGRNTVAAYQFLSLYIYLYTSKCTDYSYKVLSSSCSPSILLSLPINKYLECIFEMFAIFFVLNFLGLLSWIVIVIIVFIDAFIHLLG